MSVREHQEIKFSFAHKPNDIYKHNMRIYRYKHQYDKTFLHKTFNTLSHLHVKHPKRLCGARAHTDIHIHTQTVIVLSVDKLFPRPPVFSEDSHCATERKSLKSANPSYSSTVFIPPVYTDKSQTKTKTNQIFSALRSLTHLSVSW